MSSVPAENRAGDWLGRVALLFGAFALAIALAASSARAYVSSTWFEDAAGYEDAVRQQRAHHVPMLVYFRADWCPFCRAFDERLEASEMRSKLGAVVKVRLNPDHSSAEKDLMQRQFGANALPAIYWIPEGGTPRRLSAGKSVDEFLEQIADEIDSPLNEALRGDVLETERLGDARVRDSSVVDVDRPS